MEIVLLGEYSVRRVRCTVSHGVCLRGGWDKGREGGHVYRGWDEMLFWVMWGRIKGFI